VASPPVKSRVIAITGPTAVGKTDLCLSLAAKTPIGVVSIDSRQIYRGMDIGTAKPDTNLLSAIPHKLIDQLSPDQTISAGKYLELVQSATLELLDQGLLPVWVGGSTLYLHSLLFGIADIPEVPVEIRQDISANYETSPEVVYEELQNVDPEYAATLDVTKSQRIIRALEVFRATGKTLSSYHLEKHEPDYPYYIDLYVLSRARELLYERINSRVDGMIDDGLVDEVRTLLTEGYDLESAPAMNSIGYKEILSHLQGEVDHEEAISLVKRNSRRYAKRQITWFKKYQDIATQINLDSHTAKEAAELILD